MLLLVGEDDKPERHDRCALPVDTEIIRYVTCVLECNFSELQRRPAWNRRR